MKKIMFNDKYGLTRAVLEGRKTMTRRNTDLYKVGEVVAIAQSYYDAYHSKTPPIWQGSDAGVFNKMFVKAELMPHHIRILRKWQERLQDITDEDCLKEGIYYDKEGGQSIGYPFAVPFYYTFDGAIGKNGKQLHWTTPQEAFAALIDKVSGKGTWESNPLVWAYEYELVG